LLCWQHLQNVDQHGDHVALNKWSNKQK
jgi:hypothetical protein